MKKQIQGYYLFQTASNLVNVGKTWDVLLKENPEENKIQMLREEQKHMSDEDILRKFSDKKIKKTKKPETKKGRKHGTTSASLYRFILPLLFLSPDGKTVLRKCKVLNAREDKKYDTLSKAQWEVQYNEMMPYTISQDDGKLKFTTNPMFSLHQFTVCGGITNSKFWDINLRYASTGIMNDQEVYALTISKLSSYLKQLHDEYTQLPRYIDEKVQDKTENISNISS